MCTRPVVAFQDRLSKAVSFSERSDAIQLRLSCGRCVECRLERSRQWAVRCMHEAQLHGENNSFVTLTYNDEHIPYGGSLRYRDFQLFMKRLRRAYSDKHIRFYCAGEYGEENFRPHYHALLFGVWFEDAKYWRMSGSGHKLYRSTILEKLWPFGNSDIGRVTFQSAAYCARYIMKKQTGDCASFYDCIDPDTGEVFHREPEFNKMSLKPGIGGDWLRRFKSDVYPRGVVVVDGKESSAPRYYDKMFKREDARGFADIQERRVASAYSRRLDDIDSRLAVREEVVVARVGLLKRS